MRFNDNNSEAAHFYDIQRERNLTELQLQVESERDLEFSIALSMARIGHEGQAVCDWRREGVHDHPTGRIPAMRWIPATQAENIIQPMLI